MASPPTDALDLLRFLALSVEVHTDALCCAVDDVEAAIVESSINDERMDRLEEELAGLLERQRRLHTGQAIIAIAQKERQRGTDLRRDTQPLSQQWGDKRIQTSRTHSRVGGSTAAGTRPASEREDSPADASMRCRSTTEGSLEEDVASIDRQVELHKAKIEELDCYSLRGKLLQLEKMKKAVKDIDLTALVEDAVDGFEFPSAVQALWTPHRSASPPPPLSSSVVTGGRSLFSSPPSFTPHGSPPRHSRTHERSDVGFAQLAVGNGSVVNHTNVDLLLARACQRLAGRSVDALEALASTNVSEDSAAAHVLGCTVYAAEFDRSERGELRAVMELQSMPRDALSRLYRRWEKASICTASVDARCFGARETVLAVQDFSALPADWTTTQSLSRIPLDAVLPPIRHLLSPRFTFASAAELKHLQATRVAIQRKVVQFLLGGPETNAELLRQVSGGEADRAVAAVRLAVAENTPPSASGNAWKTIVRVPRDA